MLQQMSCVLNCISEVIFCSWKIILESSFSQYFTQTGNVAFCAHMGTLLRTYTKVRCEFFACLIEISDSIINAASKCNCNQNQQEQIPSNVKNLIKIKSCNTNRFRKGKSAVMKGPYVTSFDHKYFNMKSEFSFKSCVWTWH